MAEPKVHLLEPSPGLNIIYARSLNFCIGKGGGLPWHLPREYQHFEAVTFGYPVITGRRSYDDHDGLLPNSPNIVVSRQKDLQIEDGGLLAGDLEHAALIAAELSESFFVIGGGGLIQAAIPKASCVFETVVDANIDGDTFVPHFDFSEWQTSSIFEYSKDATHRFSFKALRHDRL